jgi:hypothetical protein
MDLIEDLSRRVSKKLRTLGGRTPTQAIVCTLLRTAYLASMRTEEGRFVLGSITFADPASPEQSPPLLRRADYPGFTRLKPKRPFDVENLVKISRAINKWAGSIAVFGRTLDELQIWGVVDQLVEQNVRLHAEGEGGFLNPGSLTVSIDGVGEVSAFQGDVFLGGIRQQAIVEKEVDALRCPEMFERGLNQFSESASAIATVFRRDEAKVLVRMVYEWTNTIARLCITLRRSGTGGAFLLTPRPRMNMLKVGTRFDYSRLSDALILNVSDLEYSSLIDEVAERLSEKEGGVPDDVHSEDDLAETDAEDRNSELRGAVKLVASLASLDGVVLLTPGLRVIGFGAKIGNGRAAQTVYDGASYLRKGQSAKRIDPSRFGTRHGSMLRYCAQDREAIGVVVSQDRQVRLIFSIGRNLLLFDSVKVMNYQDGTSANFRRRADYREDRDRDRKKHRRKVMLGYSQAPKTIRQLLSAADDAAHRSQRKPRGERKLARRK